ncbi:MAG: Ig-like domain-containing protein [Chloroflexi bacterium]|nr:Ig-like domain-containing protein [Chloroflexota bacterium]MCI0648474.1 Ig-like domain-containing protein [Chloroflexota bacterium]MCI0725998.1 Ig-like domain-containing protein [Chloroflexota bacterium]
MANVQRSTLSLRGLSLFDRSALLTMIGLLLLAALLLWRGDRVGVPVAQLSPADGAGGVSTRATLRITFAQDMATSASPELSISPPVSGAIRWEGRTLVFQPAVPLAPDTAYTATLPAGLSSQGGRQVLRPVTWQFRTGRPRVVYLAWDASRRNQLFVISMDGGQPTQLTRSPDDVLDYGISPDGQTIAYSSSRPDGGTDLWAIGVDGRNRRQLLDCTGGACNNPLWSPDGWRILYERRNFTSPGGPPGSPRLWWLDLRLGETAAVFQDSQWLGLQARFSPDGRWLSYVSPQSQEVQAFNLETGRSLLIESQTGEAATWSSDNQALVVSQIQFIGESFATHLFRIDLATNEITDLSGSDTVINDGAPAWSPDGRWIAFGRKIPSVPMGRQLWLIRPDGSEATQLTSDYEVHHGPASWSPDSRTLLFQHYLLAEPGAGPGIWVLDVETKEMRQLAAPGLLPAWLP